MGADWIIIFTCGLLFLLNQGAEAADCTDFTQKATACITTFVLKQDPLADFIQSCKFKCSDFSTSTQCVNDIGGPVGCVSQLEPQLNAQMASFNLPCSYTDMQGKCPNAVKLVIPSTTSVPTKRTTQAQIGRTTSAAKKTTTQAQIRRTSKRYTATKPSGGTVTVGGTKKGTISGASSLAVGTMTCLMTGILVLTHSVS